MNIKGEKFNEYEIRITGWMARNGILMLRLAIGIIFIWFGAQKLFEGMSPAEDIAIRTISKLCFNMFAADAIRYGLAIFEVLLGVAIMFRLYLKTTLLLLFAHMLGTFTPLFLFPNEVFVSFPFFLTLEGQYIVKNIIIIAVGIVLGATVRGGGLKSTPDNNNLSH